MAEKPWLMRTYSGHTSARASNELYRTNLAKGQTGLSVAFDLPTQMGYDSDHPLARGEVGKVGVPIRHIEDMDTLFAEIPLERMNTSMTINATAPWLLALYLAVGERRNIDTRVFEGTTQNDILKEFLARGTYAFPPAPSLRLTTDVITYTVRNVPKWNPINVCSYHLQEAGATPVQEVAYTLANAVAVLDAVKASGQVAEEELPKVVGRISFFCNAGIRFVEEMCKVRAFTALWDRLALERYGVSDAKLRRFRYGVQVNSLGLTERQPENNIARILLEMVGVTLSKDARARAVQLPAWNEALGLPRPWDQQWSLRLQQILALESDLLEYEDLFEGSKVVAEKTRQIADAAWAELDQILALGGAVRAVETGYMKQRLVQSQAARVRAVESGELTVVGVNKFIETSASPLTTGGDSGILTVDPDAERHQIEGLEAFRAKRDAGAVTKALDDLKRALESGENVMPASIRAAHAGVTVGEWSGVVRELYGEYRAPTGVSAEARTGGDAGLETVRGKVKSLAGRLGRPPRLLVGKPGLDGHSNGAEQIAVRARDAGFEVIYEGIRLTPQQIANAALQEDVNLIGLSILSGSHRTLVAEVLKQLRELGVDAPVVVGGIIPEADQRELTELGVARVYTPKDYDMRAIMADLVEVVEKSAA
ncbi:MAG: protein meaA [Deltaproteobacteria bacterium]|nr:protein meaA [Deltaproteobacteria bacterium]